MIQIGAAAVKYVSMLLVKFARNIVKLRYDGMWYLWPSVLLFSQNYNYTDQNCRNDLKRFITICPTKPRCNWKGPLLQVEVSILCFFLFV